MKPIAFVHAGGPKTGSTSIQSYIKTNEVWFREHGIFVPATGRRDMGVRNHHGLNHLLADPHTRDDTAAKLQKEIIDASRPNVLVSAESFPSGFFQAVSELASSSTIDKNHSIPIVEALKHIGYNIKVIYYVRYTPELMNSRYTQDVKALRTRLRFGRYTKRLLEHSNQILGMWSKVAAMDGVEFAARPFNAETKRKGVVRDFVTTIGLPAPDEEPRRENETIGPIYLHASRIAQDRLDRVSYASEHRKIRVIRRGISIAYRRLGLDEQGYCGLTARRVGEYDKITKDAEEEFAQRHWGQSWQTVFERECSKPYVNNDVLEAKDSSEGRAQARQLTIAGLQWAREKLAD